MRRPPTPLLCLSSVLLALCAGAAQADVDATALLRDAMKYWRAQTSYTAITMTVHRPDWERTMSVEGWTSGDNNSLVRFTAPAKDAGNATLVLPTATWVFNPKINQVIQLPAGMMSQSWMGSDFSYNDLAKSEAVVTDYTHKLTGTAQLDGHTVWTIEALPKPDAPVVWGKQVIRIRDDKIMLTEVFYDQDMKPVRQMDTTKIAELGGRMYPVESQMKALDEPGKWTTIDYSEARFNLPLDGALFTLANLRNPRPWKP